MNLIRKSNLCLLWLTVAALVCCFAAAGCSKSADGNAVSSGDAAVSSSDRISPSDREHASRMTDLIDVKNATDGTLSAVASAADLITAATTSTIEEIQSTPTTWNDEFPYVPYSSDKYKVTVYRGSQSAVVYEQDEEGLYGKVVKRFTCSTGMFDDTMTGVYYVRAKYRWRFMDGVYGQYCTSISTSYLFHSVPYQRKDVSTMLDEEYDKLGKTASHGCIRMCVRDCKWIYDNIPLGTEVRIIQDKGPSGVGVPSRSKSSTYSGWDPTDRWAQGSPYFDKSNS